MERKNFYNGMELGPILPSDARVLEAIIMATNPKVVIEFGHFWGTSARVMLRAMDHDAELHSFDNTKDGKIDDPRFHFYRQSQETISGIDNIDFVFLDASHDLELNKATFQALQGHLSGKAIIAVHDTGTWVGGNVFNCDFGKPDAKGNWIHNQGELDFVNWLKESHPDWQQIHLHSSRQVRHGITLLQRYIKL